MSALRLEPGDEVFDADIDEDWQAYLERMAKSGGNTPTSPSSGQPQGSLAVRSLSGVAIMKAGGIIASTEMTSVATLCPSSLMGWGTMRESTSSGCSSSHALQTLKLRKLRTRFLQRKCIDHRLVFPTDSFFNSLCSTDRFLSLTDFWQDAPQRPRGAQSSKKRPASAQDLPHAEHTPAAKNAGGLWHVFCSASRRAESTPARRLIAPTRLKAKTFRGRA